MKIQVTLAAVLLALVGGVAQAQVPVTGATTAAAQTAMLASADPKLAANKKLVFDFWREVLDARHVELAEKYMAEDYIQHNPNVPTGRKAFTDFFGRMKPMDIKPVTNMPLVSIMAEGDLVMMAFAREWDHPVDKTKKYTSTWFDLFRVENGKVAEHWDGALIAPPPAR